jgi:flagellar hook-associated protein 2
VSGTDVAGTINGIAATGVGQLLTASKDDSQAGGLSLRITGTATGDLGNVTYTAGIAAKLQTAVARSTNSATGSIVQKIKTTKTQSKDLADQITAMQARYDNRMQALKDQFATLETTLSQLKSQLAYITQQMDSLNANWGNNGK